MKKSNNPVVDESFDFAVNIVKLYNAIEDQHKEYTLSKQLLRSSASIEAIIEGTQGGYTKKEFRAKLSISYKELRETKYWLRLLLHTDYIKEETYNVLFNDANELGRLLFTIIRNTDTGKS